MKAILLAAGYGTRLRPITNNTPKCLVEVNGKPLLQYWIEMLFDAGVESILINTHYLAEKVTRFLDGLGYSDKITVVYEEELLGTAGTIKKNKKFIGNEPCIILHADNFTVCDFKGFISSHYTRPEKTKISMMTYCTDRPKESGIVKLDENGVVVDFYEKVESPPGNLANAAAYIIDVEVADLIDEMGFSDFSTEVIPSYLNKISTWHNDVYHIDIGTPDALKKANTDAVDLFN